MHTSDVYTSEQEKRWDVAAKSDETVFIRSADEVNSLSSRPNNSGPLTWKFRIENARDVAWASSSAFILEKQESEIDVSLITLGTNRSVGSGDVNQASSVTGTTN